MGSKGIRPSLTGCGTERKSQVWGRDQVTISFFLNYSLPGWCWDWSSFVSFLGLLPTASEPALSSFRPTAWELCGLEISGLEISRSPCSPRGGRK